MKFDNKVKWFLFACGCSLILIIVGINYFLTEVESKKSSVRLNREKLDNESEWLVYQNLWGKIPVLTQGWRRPTDRPNLNRDFEMVIPIKDAVAKQINEIERIHQEEILSKLSSGERLYQEYRQKLLRDLEYEYQEKLKASQIAFEADLASKKKRQAKALSDFRQNLERKHQLTLINLELQKKMLIFSAADTEKQQNEANRIEAEIARIREDLKKKIDQFSIDQEQEFKLYQKRKQVEYSMELSELRKEKERMLQTELNRFQEEQRKDFEAWKSQRQAEVEQAIKLRRFQK